MFKEQDFKEHLKNPLIIKDEKLVQKDHFSSDSPLVLPAPSKTQQDYAIHANGSTAPKLVVFDDTMHVVTHEDKPLPSQKRSDIHVGERFVLESVTFGSNVAVNIKQHHNYVENAYPFS